VQPFVIVVVKIVGDAGLRVGQVGKNGPLSYFEDLCFEARRLYERNAPWSCSSWR
jgi:ubiquitin